MHVNPDANDLMTFGQAFIASLQIQSTIGFAAPGKKHWTHNWAAILVVVVHSIVTILFNVFLLGTLFSRMSSAKNRAVTVKFSNKIIVSNSTSSPTLKFRVGETRRRQLLNLNVSAYLYNHKGEDLFHREQLLITPSSGIFLAVPVEISHTIDHTSPVWQFLNKYITQSEDTSPISGLSSYSCRVCGDRFSSLDQLQKHLRFRTDVTHRRLQADFASLTAPTIQAIKRAVGEAKSDYFEIIILVEGTEPVTGSAIQVRYSYSLNDIEFGGSFAPCQGVQEGSETKLVVDFDKFDEIVTRE
jgi:hypothetical protein